MFCINCGAKNEDGALFCTNCGSPLNVQDQTETLKENEVADTLAEAQAVVEQMNNETHDFSQPVDELKPAQTPAYQPDNTYTNERTQQTYGQNSPYSAENTKKLNKQTKNTIILLVAAVVVIAAVCAVLSITGVIGGKTYKTYDALVEEYLDEVDDLNPSKLIKFYNKDVIDTMREVYSWEADDDAFMQSSDYLYKTAVDCGVEVPDFYIANTSSYTEFLASFEEMENLAGKDLGILEVIIIEVDATLTAEQENYYDSYYYITAYRTGEGWYLLFVE